MKIFQDKILKQNKNANIKKIQSININNYFQHKIIKKMKKFKKMKDQLYY